MEKYTRSCRIILCCESVSKVISPLKSRCLNIRVPAPSKSEMAQILGQSQVPDTGNIRRAKLKIGEMEWEVYIQKLAKAIGSGKDILKLREFLYALLTTGVPEDIVFRKLTTELIKLKEYQDHITDIITWGSHYQHHSIQGQKPIYHLEAFISKVQTI